MELNLTTVPILRDSTHKTQCDITNYRSGANHTTQRVFAAEWYGAIETSTVVPRRANVRWYNSPAGAFHSDSPLADVQRLGVFYIFVVNLYRTALALNLFQQIK